LIEPQPKRILIVRLGGIGDVVCTLPSLEALRAGIPDAFIGYAVEEPAFPLVNGHPALDRVHLFQRRRLVQEAKNPFQWPEVIGDIRKYRLELQNEEYDVALDFQRNFKGGIHSLMSGARMRVGFTSPTAQEFNHYFHQITIDPAPAEHWVDKFLVLAAAIGGKPEAARYRLPDAPESRTRVEAFLAQNELKSFIAMHPSSSGFDPDRLWEPGRFGALTQRIGEMYGMKTVITWGPGERALAESVVQNSGGHAMLSFESRSLLDLAELYRRSRIYIGCDTGPMHIATAVGLPSVVLFGSGNPSAYGPRSPGSRIVAKYENGKLRPMSDIMIDDAFAVVDAVLRTV
jgi:heptosyltransferase I